jgi:hypothetical protein
MDIYSIIYMYKHNYNNKPNYQNQNYNQNYNKHYEKKENNYENNNEYSNDNINILIKESILDYLYNRIEIGDHKYTIIRNVGDIYELKNDRYYVSGNSCGINSIIIFMKKNNNYYSYLIDRRSISYNRQTLNKAKVRFTEIKLSVDLKIYDGTIIDGILIDNDANKISLKNNIVNLNMEINAVGKNENSKMLFMITDVFVLNGKSIINMNYKKKMYLMNDIINKYVENNNKNNIELFISQPYELNQISSLFQENIHNNNKKYNIKGIAFYPELSGSKLIYIFDKNDEKIKEELLKGVENIDNNAFNLEEETGDKDLNNIDKKIIYKYEIKDIENIKEIIINLEMKKTLINDVYKLYAIFNYKNKYIKKKIGIAYIPTFILSLKCKNLFLNKENIIMKCLLFNNKWIPLEESDVNKIDIINLDTRFKIIEEILENYDDLHDDES